MLNKNFNSSLEAFEVAKYYNETFVCFIKIGEQWHKRMNYVDIPDVVRLFLDQPVAWCFNRMDSGKCSSEVDTVVESHCLCLFHRRGKKASLPFSGSMTIPL